MFNLFALILMICTFFSGLCWIVKYFDIGSYVYSFLQYKLKHFFSFHNILRQWRLFRFIQKIFCYFVNYFFDFCASLFPVLFFVFIVRSFIFEPFQIPSGSMMPTLLAGDFILVNKFCYGIKNPVTQSVLVRVGQPKRGDVVVFKYPLNTKLDYIKRVVGLPGDRVIYNSLSKELIIYPKNVMKEGNDVNKPISITYTNIFLSNFFQIFNFNNGDIVSDFYHFSSDKIVNNGIRLMQSSESFDGVVHNILTVLAPGSYNFSTKVHNKEQLDEFISEWIVPVGEYFMLGDNRDNSADSRYWGFVPEKNLVGKAIIIWFSFEKKQGDNWPIIIRFHRFGKIY
ncbi:signal peptidase I [Blochmannia endosymbiont of Polyrhachis (Hedomyrma) turneri]|uniref:signal peptidase I n=1 Tax=Blochmannia endosymbiont of Polyrhachis (Hedomyrma) turneri TaxID=1505596 RepID=UPI00061A7116|nr:signal peptidase I [Blochmannia endosymbiont of Polyrhachis (Hedomyrma) turneri]AKC60102.1 signal peptidase I [Blochmannia endosymbiont of Polyrhachis (Hedomyrma) turneri]